MMNLKQLLRLTSMAVLLAFAQTFAQEQRIISYAGNQSPFQRVDSASNLVSNNKNKVNLSVLRENPNYGLVEDFKEGFSRIQKNQVYGFLNETGQELITPQYDYAEAFNQGKALVKKFYWYFIDANGNESEVLKNVVEAKAYHAGKSIVKFGNGKMALIDNGFDVSEKPISQEFDEISVLNSTRLIVRNNNKYGLIDIEGRVLLNFEYDKIKKIAESDEWMIIEKNKKQGLVDVSGEAFIKADYDKIETFSVLSVGDKTFLNLLATNEKGVRLIEIGNRQISDTYQKIDEFNQFGLAKVFKKENGDNFGYIDFTGQEIIKSAYAEMGQFNRFGLVIANNANKESTLFDFKGSIILPPNKGINLAISDSLFAPNTLIIRLFENNNMTKLHLLDKKTMKILTHEAYTGIGRFGNYFMFQKNNKWGLMERNGEEFLKPQYEDFLFESENIIGVKYENEKFGYIDKKGKIKGSFDYQTITPFKNGLAIVSKGNGKMGVINGFNAKIIPLVFKNISRENSVFVVDDASERYTIDREGNCLENCEKYNKILIKLNKN